MHYQHLSNFIHNSIRQNDIYVPGMILFLVKNGGKGTKEQISRLLYIFDFKHDLNYYDTIVEKFAAVMLEEYNIIHKNEEVYILNTWPLNDDQILDIIKLCMRVSNGFFSHIKYTSEGLKKAS